MRHALKALAAILVLGCAQQAQAVPMEFTARLSGPNESPPNASPGIGTADVVFDPVASTMRVMVTFSGLTSNSTASHIHCCTAVPFTGTAGVATTTPTFPLFPLGVTAGSYDQTFDMTQSSSYNPSFITGHGGTTASAESALFWAMMSDETYLNIHTSNFPSGEIRGFLVYVPEPVTLSMFGIGLAGAALLRRRRKVSA